MVFTPGRTQPLSDLSAQYLRDNYLLGLKFVDDSKNPYPDSFYEAKIDVAIAQFETHTNLTFVPTQFVNELHDYHAKDYAAFALLQLFHYPVLIKSPDYALPAVSAQLGTQTLTTFPPEWVRTEQARGQIHLLPTVGTISQVIMTMSGQYLPLIFGRGGYMPQLFSATYWAGFDPAAIPRLIIDIIAKLAAIEILSIMGITVYPPGISSSSIGADGLSTSRSINQGQDTAPVFSGLIKQYKADLFGNPSMKIDGLINQLQMYYGGMTMTVLG